MNICVVDLLTAKVHAEIYNTKVHAEMLFCMSNIMDDCLQSSFHGPIVNFLVHCNDCIVLVVVVVSYLNMQFIK